MYRAPVEAEEPWGPEGEVEPRFEAVRDVFAGVLREQRGTGAAVAAWHDGRWVVNLWGGTADAAGTRRWQRHSIVQPYSVTKPFAAMCALLLIDRGTLDLDAPMQRYWPEFTAPATVRHVLSHQAGVVALDAPASTEVFYDWERMSALLAAQQPHWPPGTAHGESALFYGHLVGELVRRVDGRRLGQFLRDEVCIPLGLDFTVGLTREQQARAVDLTCFDDLDPTTRSDLYRHATTNPPGAHDPAVVNSAAWRAAEIPAITDTARRGGSPVCTWRCCVASCSRRRCCARPRHRSAQVWMPSSATTTRGDWASRSMTATSAWVAREGALAGLARGARMRSPSSPAPWAAKRAASA